MITCPSGETSPHLSGSLLGTVMAGVLVLVVVGTPARAAESGVPGWRELLGRATNAAGTVTYSGDLVVVSFNEEHPTVTELEVVQNEDGTMVSGSSRTWMLGRIDGQAYFADESSDRLLVLGGVDRAEMSPHRIEDNYAVEVRDGQKVLSRPAVALDFVDRRTTNLRERLFIDDRSGLVVRRETYDDGGEPVRLLAFTRLSLDEVELPEVRDMWPEEEHANQTTVSRESLAILRDVGWTVPDGLGSGFDILEAKALSGGEDLAGLVGGPSPPTAEGEPSREALHLLYGDGLYTLSVYEQHGRLEDDALRAQGAVRVAAGGHALYRWPGSQPVTYVWTGDELTFTVVSDAPPDVIFAAVEAFPHESSPTFMRRLGRGFVRVGSWLWPFG